MPSMTKGLKCHLLEIGHETGQWERKKYQGLTFQETHCAVEAFRTKLIVAKRTQQLADNNVRTFRNYEGPHVAKKNFNVFPPFGSLPFLQTKEEVTST